MPISELSFKCPLCETNTLPAKEATPVKYEWSIDPQDALQEHVKRVEKESFLFWQCPNPRCLNHKLYYKTDAEGNFIKVLRYPSIET